MKKIILVCVVLVLAGCDGAPINVFDVGAAKERREMEEKWRKVHKPLGDCEYGDRKCHGLEMIKQIQEMKRNSRSIILKKNQETKTEEK